MGQYPLRSCTRRKASAQEIGNPHQRIRAPEGVHPASDTDLLRVPRGLNMKCHRDLLATPSSLGSNFISFFKHGRLPLPLLHLGQSTLPSPSPGHSSPLANSGSSFSELMCLRRGLLKQLSLTSPKSGSGAPSTTTPSWFWIVVVH